MVGKTTSQYKRRKRVLGGACLDSPWICSLLPFEHPKDRPRKVFRFCLAFDPSKFRGILLTSDGYIIRIGLWLAL